MDGMMVTKKLLYIKPFAGLVCNHCPSYTCKSPAGAGLQPVPYYIFLRFKIRKDFRKIASRMNDAQNNDFLPRVFVKDFITRVANDAVIAVLLEQWFGWITFGLGAQSLNGIKKAQQHLAGDRGRSFRSEILTNIL